MHLLLVLDAPWMSFGGETVDALGVVRPFPARSMIAGLLANALGFDRGETERLAALQSRLVMGAARLCPGQPVRDFQTARLEAGDRGWTRLGRVEGRAGGAGTYAGPHIRIRDAEADALVLVALRLDPADEEPDLDTAAHALRSPERPLFLGRKPCLPSRPVLAGRIAARDIRGALEAGLASTVRPSESAIALHPSREGDTGADRGPVAAQWPAGEGEAGPRTRTNMICDERAPSGVHAGARAVVEGRIGGRARGASEEMAREGRDAPAPPEPGEGRAARADAIPPDPSGDWA